VNQVPGRQSVICLKFMTYFVFSCVRQGRAHDSENEVVFCFVKAKLHLHGQTNKLVRLSVRQGGLQLVRSSIPPKAIVRKIVLLTAIIVRMIVPLTAIIVRKIVPLTEIVYSFLCARLHKCSLTINTHCNAI